MAQRDGRGKGNGRLFRGVRVMRRQPGRRVPRRAGGTTIGAAKLRPMKIYTRTGDDGTTGLLGPGRIPKSAPRVEAYGAVDELNATLGVVGAHDGAGAIASELRTIQSTLFVLGAELATTERNPKLPHVSEAEIAVLESWIDRLEADLPALRNFILPGGTAAAAQLHFARTVCRRAERRVVLLAGLEPVEGNVVRYLNRLADLLFVMARHANLRAGIGDVEWSAGSQ